MAVKNGKIPVWAEHIRRWKTQILCVLGGFLLYAVSVSDLASDKNLAAGYLPRGGYGEGETVYEFQVEGLADEPVEFRMEVGARQYTAYEAEEVFDRIFESLEEQMPGDNPSLTEVRTDLTLPTEFPGTGVSARWQSDAPDILDSYGHILEKDIPEEGAQVWLTAELTDGVHQGMRIFPVKIYPPILTQEQKLEADFQEKLRIAAQNEPSGTEIKLPETYEGKKLRYSRETGDYKIIPVLGILLAAIFRARDKQKSQEDKKRRRELLQLDYADVVYQLMVFVGAGLTVTKAWELIVRNYEKRRSENRCGIKPAFEEMADAGARMRCGVPESRAIAEFGQKCQLQTYLKLTGLLEQNRRTGTKNLTQLLAQEMDLAWEQQKNIARRLGEEAGTKLLLPLMMMLLVVMVIIMIPAMMSMT